MDGKVSLREIMGAERRERQLSLNYLIRSKDEWSKLAAWIVDNNLFSANVRWLIQVPRLYNLYKSKHSVKNFEEVISSKNKRKKRRAGGLIPQLDILQIFSSPCSW